MKKDFFKVLLVAAIGMSLLGCEKSLKTIRSLFGRSLPAPVVSKEFLSLNKDNKLYLAVADSKTDYRFKGRCDLETKDLWVRFNGMVAKVPNQDGSSSQDFSLNDWQLVNKVALPEAKIDCATGEFDFTIRIEGAGSAVQPEAMFSIKGGAPVGESDTSEVPIIKADPLVVTADAPAIANEKDRYYISVNDSKPVTLTPKGGLAPFEFRLLTSNVAGLPKDGRFDCRAFSNVCSVVGEKKVRLRVVDSVLQQYDILLDLKPHVQAKALVPGSATKVLFDTETANQNPVEVPAGSNLRIEARGGITEATAQGANAYTFKSEGVGAFDNQDVSLFRTKVDSFAAQRLQDTITVLDARGNKVNIAVRLTEPLTLVLNGESKIKRGGSLNISAKGGRAPYIFSVDKLDGKEIGSIRVDKNDPSKAIFKASLDFKNEVYPVIRVIDEFGNTDKTEQGSSKEVKVSN